MLRNSVDLLGDGRGGFRSEDGHWHTALPQVQNENAGGTGTAGVSLFMACGVTAQWGRAVGAWGAWEAGDGDDGGGSAGAHLPV